MKKRKGRRTWCYTQRPHVFCIDPHKCGSPANDWSEYKGHLWCAKCKVDYVPKHWGVLDGPIPLKLANMMGIRFDRYDLKKKKVIKQEEYLKAAKP